MEKIAIPIKRFLTMPQCPAAWKRHNLYLFRDDEIVFYVGQSRHAFGRVWDHLHDGFKGRSAVGRFVLCNWPRSMRFIVELMNSRSARFDIVGNNLDAAERHLIAGLSPCFNEALNERPTPLPATYSPPNASVRHPRSIKTMMRQAEYALYQDSRKAAWR